MVTTSRRTILVLGGTSGIGRATALSLGAAGERVLIVGRNPVRGEEVLAAVRDSGGDGAFIGADLSSLAEVDRMVNTVREGNETLNGIVHSAGGVRFKRVETVDGFEATYATYVLARHLLTRRLLPLLYAGGAGRIVIVAVSPPDRMKLDFPSLESPPEPFKYLKTIPQNQIANVAFALHLSKMLEGTGTTINVMSPGFVDTGVVREGPKWMRSIYGVIGRTVGNSPEEAAGAVVALLAPGPPGNLNGHVFPSVKKLEEGRPIVRDAAEADELWRRTEQKLVEKGYHPDS